MKKVICILIILTVVIYLPSYSQNDQADSTASVVDTLARDIGLFRSDEILNLSLRFDVAEYRRKKPKDEYLKATLTYHINEKDSINKEIRLKSRGVTRNSICNFPPISLNFKKTDFRDSGLIKIEKLKMVTHCNPGDEEYLFKEYLIYKMYNALTDFSFKVRLVKVDYINTGKKSMIIRSYAFLIEPENLLAERTKSVPIDLLTLSQKNIIPEMLDRMAIFSYMIGNHDWSIAGQHNCKVLSVIDFSNPGLSAVVPYDFDYAGLVDASYAVPREGLGLKSVRERIYQGSCRTAEVFKNRTEEFSDKKLEFYRIVTDFQYLTEKTRKEMIKYLDEFYFDLEKNNILIDNLLEECNINSR